MLCYYGEGANNLGKGYKSKLTQGGQGTCHHLHIQMVQLGVP